MHDGLIFTDTRPRAKSTGHAFGLEGNLGMPVIVSALVSVGLLTLLFSSAVTVALPARFLVGFAPVLLTATYVVALRRGRPPRYDVDLIRSLVNGPALQPARRQPLHPYLHP